MAPPLHPEGSRGGRRAAKTVRYPVPLVTSPVQPLPLGSANNAIQVCRVSTNWYGKYQLDATPRPVRTIRFMGLLPLGARTHLTRRLRSYQPASSSTVHVCLRLFTSSLLSNRRARWARTPQAPPSAPPPTHPGQHSHAVRPVKRAAAVLALHRLPAEAPEGDGKGRGRECRPELPTAHVYDDLSTWLAPGGALGVSMGCADDPSIHASTVTVTIVPPMHP
jgi:hypothetical protein